MILQNAWDLAKEFRRNKFKRVQAVIIYVNAHYMDKLTLDGIADYMRLNRNI